MSLTVNNLAMPLHYDDGGVIRVGNTRVPIDTVIEQYKQGATPEQIVERFDVLKLSDVYATIAYYLDHREDIESYLEHGQQERARIRREVEAKFDNSELHARLLKAKMDKKSRQIDNK